MHALTVVADKLLSRRRLLAGLAASASLASLRGAARAVAQEPAESGEVVPGLWESFPRMDPEKVRAVVGAAHTDLHEVSRLVERQPALARSSWDWGFGDWESALGAAAHMGRRDIAELLLRHGARPTLFSAAMLGQLDVVRGFVAAQPGVQRTLGPHGLTLLTHARAGGSEALGVVAYLEELGDADRPTPTEPLSEEDREVVIGEYVAGTNAPYELIVDWQSGRLGLTITGASRRFLLHQGELRFFPSGVPSVTIVFERSEQRVVRLRIVDGEEVLVATRRT